MTKERIAKFCEKFNTHKATLIQDTDRYLMIGEGLMEAEIIMMKKML